MMKFAFGLVSVAAVLSASPAFAQDDTPFADCVAHLRAALPRHPDVTKETFDTYTSGTTDLRPVIASATQSQPEFQLAIWDYLARRVDDQRIAQGRALVASQGAALDAIRERQGIDGATVVALFGIETDFGRARGGYPVVDATLSRACLNWKSADREQQFFSALWLLQQGIVQRDDFKGSWAGAFGMTQFMPATFVRHLDDGPGTPPADIIHSVPDALATTARYLRGLGWTTGLPWGVEVMVPDAVATSAAVLAGDHGCLSAGGSGAGTGAAARAGAGAVATGAGGDVAAGDGVTSPGAVGNAAVADEGSGACRAAAQWRAAGVTRIDGRPLPAWPDVTMALLMPAGPLGPAWLVTPNYQALWRYNRADAYALAIGLLSDALRGDSPQRAAWPTDDLGLSRADFTALQALLLAHGHCEVAVDGSQGPITAAAIRDEEGRLGWPVTGHAGTKMLAQLRAAATAMPASPTASAAAESAGFATCPR